MNRAVLAKAASLLLRYPDASLLSVLPQIRAALPPSSPLSLVERHLATGDPTMLAVEYVDTFDLRRRSCLHLTYYTAGDTRKRGSSLVDFAAVYRAHGLMVDGGELPDYLPAVLELAAQVGDPGWRLLGEHRVGLDLLSQALRTSVYRHAVDAVRAVLPAATPSDLAAVAGLVRSGPPREEVGLQPFALSPGGPR